VKDENIGQDQWLAAVRLRQEASCQCKQVQPKRDDQTACDYCFPARDPSKRLVFAFVHDRDATFQKEYCTNVDSDSTA